MSDGRVRPRFTLTVPTAPEEAIRRMETTVEAAASQCVWRTLGNHVDVTVARGIRHRWSPCVQLEFAPLGEEQTLVNGIIGPHPNVWTLFMFINSTIALIGCFGALFGLSQVMLDRAAWAFWLVPVSILALAGMYALSQFGQRCAREQTELLMTLVHEALSDDVPHSSERDA